MLLKGKTWLFINSFLWLISGSWLLFKGLMFFDQAFLASPNSIAPDSLYRMLGSAENVCTAHIMASVVIGFIKGRYVLSRTVTRILSKAMPFTDKKRAAEIFDRRYAIVLLSMMGIGMLFKFVPIHLVLRAVVDTAVGSALIQGAWLYIRGYFLQKNASAAEL